MATSTEVPTFCSTRGRSFLPTASAVARQAEVEAQIAEAREQQREQKRAYGRKLDEEAKARRRQRRIEIERCYAERWGEDE